MKPSLIKIFFLCENFEALDQALKLKAALVNNCRDHGVVQASFYEFARLDHPQLRENATSEAATADILIVSSGGKHVLPLFVQNWLAGFNPRKEKIACVGYVRAGLTDEPGCEFLERWSNRMGAVFFSNCPAFSTGGDLKSNHLDGTAVPICFPRPARISDSSRQTLLKSL